MQPSKRVLLCVVPRLALAILWSLALAALHSAHLISSKDNLPFAHLRLDFALLILTAGEIPLLALPKTGNLMARVAPITTFALLVTSARTESAWE